LTVVTSAANAVALYRDEQRLDRRRMDLADGLPGFGGATIYRGGRIVTEAGGAVADALAVAAGRVIAVGAEADVRAAAGRPAGTVDLAGRTVIPGLADVHTHIAGNCLYDRLVECRDTVDPAVASVAEIVARMSARAKETRPGGYVIGVGAMAQNTRLAEGRWPTADDLDAACPDNPAYVMFGSHVTVANSLALRAGGIDETTPDPYGGRIDHDSVTGRPNGILREKAKVPVVRDLVATFGFEVFLDTLEAALVRCASTGITTIHDICATRDQFRAYQELARRGRLPIRVMALIRVIEGEFSIESLLDLQLQTGFGGDRLWFGGAKISLDGAPSSRSAVFHDELPGHPKSGALLRVPQDDLIDVVRRYHDAGIRLCIHTLGDGAIDNALEAFAAAGATPGGPRHRLEHFGNWMVTPERVDACQRLGLTPVPNPPFLHYQGDDHRLMFGGDDSEYVKTIYPYRTLHESGFRFSGGSDAPGFYRTGGVRDLGLMAYRVTRSGHHWNPDEDLTVEQSLRAQTANAAWLGYREDRAGRLVPGADADFVVLDCPDLLAVPPAEVAAIPVVRTVVDGQTVYLDNAYRGGEADDAATG
jgi:predicted amidohydrolase YtcJ